MLNKFKKILLVSAFSWLIICPAPSFAWHDYAGYGDWDYYGSGRDHPLSAYIDRKSYVGPADYMPIEPDYINGPLVFSYITPITTTPAPIQTITQLPAPSLPQPAEFTVNIPNMHGGYNVVVIKKSGEGYIGPQGEYYPEFPKIFQLQMKYEQ